MQVAFIGFGEVGYEMSRGLRDAGLKNITAYDPAQNHPVFSKILRERVQAAGVELMATAQQAMEKAEIVITAVTSDKALEVSRQVRPFLRAGIMYVDVAASSPQVKRDIWETIRDSGASFVDAAMMGPLALYQQKVPILASGTGAKRFLELMTPYGMAIEYVSEAPGEATGIKLVRSIFMKGLAALELEMLEAACRMKVDHLVLDSLAVTMDSLSFKKQLNRLITGTSVHAERRAHEMENVIEMLESVGVAPSMSRATYDRLHWLAGKGLREKFGGKPPAKWEEVIQACEQSGSAKA